MKGTKKTNFLLTFGSSSSGGVAIAPSLPTDGLMANWDVSDFSSISFRSGANLGVTAIKSQVGISPDLDLVEFSNYGYEPYDPQYNATEKAIVGSPTPVANGLKKYSNVTLLHATDMAYTFILVCKLTDLTTNTPILWSGYYFQTGLINYDASLGKLYSRDGDNNRAIMTVPPQANTKMLIYTSGEGTTLYHLSDLKIFMNNEIGLGEFSGNGSQINEGTFGNGGQYPGSGDIYTYQLLYYNKILTDKEKTAVLQNLNTKWKIW